MREAGKVKWYSSGQGFGFIVPDKPSDDLYFHQSNLPRSRRFEPQTGDHVSFEVREGPRGLFAATVEFKREEGAACDTKSSEHHTGK